MTIFSQIINDQPSWKLVLDGDKTQTRRLRQSKHMTYTDDIDNFEFVLVGMDRGMPVVSGLPIARITNRQRTVWEVGKTYAVQPARAMPAIWWKPTTGEYTTDAIQYAPSFTMNGLVDYDNIIRKDFRCGLKTGGWQELRIRITSIRREDVRTISHADAIAEGCESVHQFLSIWVGMHDKPALATPAENDYHSFQERLNRRPSQFYDAWQLSFEVVR